ncbi:MAG: hypothetical protein ACFCD0_11840 [Gemmataceae bacterium]
MASQHAAPRTLLIDDQTGLWLRGIAVPRHYVIYPDPTQPQRQSSSVQQRSPESVTVDQSSLQLGTAPRGALSLNSADGSLGRLTLPKLIAVDQELRVYLLSLKEHQILRFDPDERGAQVFKPLPGMGGRRKDTQQSCEVTEAKKYVRRFQQPTSIACDRSNLYVVDSGSESRSVKVFALESLALRALWTFRERPLDVATDGAAVYILFANEIWRHQPGDTKPERFIPSEAAESTTGPWSRLALDGEGRLYALQKINSEAFVLDVFQRSGKLAKKDGKPRLIHDPSEVRDEFDFPLVWSGADQDSDSGLLFVLTAGLARNCGRERPSSNVALDALFSVCLPGTSSSQSSEQGPESERRHAQGVGLVFTSDGRRKEVKECRYPRRPFYQKTGQWISPKLDSQIYRCQWHRIEITFQDLPRGTVVEIETLTRDEVPYSEEQEADKRAFFENVAPKAWDKAFRIVGEDEEDNDLDPNTGDGPKRLYRDGLVLGPPGRYLWLRVTLIGGSFATPVLESIRIHYPRQSYLEYLPNIFSQDDPSRQFLERYLSIFQTEWDNLEQRIDEFGRFLDPQAVPANGGFLEYLAGWLGASFEPEWTSEQRRTFMQEIPKLTFAAREKEKADPGANRRGTLSGLRDYIRTYLDALNSAAKVKALSFPMIIEGFRERDFFFLLRNEGRTVLASSDAVGQGPSPRSPIPLWGNQVVNRMRLDDQSRLDEARLLSEGDPQLDVFNEYSCQFRIFLPSVWVPTATDERLLTNAIDEEKPAHTTYTLHLVDPRFRVGVQSACGINTILGTTRPKTFLPSREDEANWPASKPPTGRLGYDIVLASKADRDSVRLGHDVRLGVEAMFL